MPARFRKNFLPVAVPAGGTGAPTTPSVAAAPLPLALVVADRIAQLNEPGRILLQDHRGGSDHANRRWLEAAVARLVAGGRTREVLPAGERSPGLEVVLGPEQPAGQGRLLALREATVAGAGDSDLVATVSTLSHELRTPLASMKSSLGLVLAGEAGPVAPEQAHFLAMTMRNINRLERLVSDLLDVSRSQGGAAPLQRREVDLGPVLREAVQAHEAAARQARLDLDATGLPDSLPAHADPDRITQILANLVANSIKYTPPGGLVRVWVEPRSRPDDGLASRLSRALGLPLATFTLVVEDSGVGMTAAEVDRVFEPWFRGRGGIGGQAPGSGLGLHITRALVEAHGGRIRLASAPGRGTTVWVRLPGDPASEAVLRGAGQLAALRQRGGAAADRAAIAVLDGRPDRPVRDRAQAFLARRGGGPDDKVIELAPAVVACLVADPADWAAAWRSWDGDRTDPKVPWRFVAWPPEDQ